MSDTLTSISQLNLLSLPQLLAIKRQIDSLIEQGETKPLRSGLSKQSWPRDNQADLDAFYGVATPEGTDLVTVTIPWRCTDQRVRVARKVAASLERVLGAYWDSIGHDQSRIDSEHLNICDGAFNYRNTRGSTTLSNHARGAAIDWAAAYNPLGSGWHPGGGMVPVEFIRAFQAEGWRWGGLYKGRKDPMHFEAIANDQPPVSANSDLPLNIGSVGPKVLQVQAVVGADHDGIYGDSTKTAVKTWQSAHGLDADGVVGDRTWAAMTGATKPPSHALSAGAQICLKLLTKFRQSSIVGVAPSDGAQFGIATGTPEQWAIFGTAVADAESSFNPRTRNTSDPGGSYGIFQYAHNQVPGGNAFDVDASCSAFVRDCEASAHGGLRAGILGQRFSTIGRHPDRTIAKLGEAKRLAASVFVGEQTVSDTVGTTTQTTPATPPPQPDLASIQQDIAHLGGMFAQFTNQLGQLPTTGLPPQMVQIEQSVTRLGQIVGSLSQTATTLSGPAAAAGGAAPEQALSPIDKLLGGSAFVGLKTPIAIFGYLGLWVLQSLDAVGTVTGDKATTTGSVLTALFSGLGAAGVTAKFDRAFQALSAISGVLQKLPGPPPSTPPKVDG